MQVKITSFFLSEAPEKPEFSFPIFSDTPRANSGFLGVFPIKKHDVILTDQELRFMRTYQRLGVGKQFYSSKFKIDGKRPIFRVFPYRRLRTKVTLSVTQYQGQVKLHFGGGGAVTLGVWTLWGGGLHN